MGLILDLFWNARRTLQFVAQILIYAWAFLLALLQPKAVLAARLLAAQSQLAMCKDRIQQKKDPRPRFTTAFRILWVVLSKALDRWHDWAHLMTGNSQEMAHHGLSLVLAMEIQIRQTGHQPRDAAAHSQAQPRESVMECRADTRYTASVAVRAAA